ncbi:uncharacterized protein EV420DRAFT_1551746 [Desarmillaria tabescens]|uniref:Uncharacterized protein n=1 Tax=Armillaria tabescens TaxID=1929756 RepID=A0AA39N4H5_ARMTA|nr:uncharacterized protein EV420DRAFT_1551746 [Desarmillaria tabescens]KAK0457143.1 hypothetical protein EV420DRAFT_1551746 [Desarmillaria tabescens]
MLALRYWEYALSLPDDHFLSYAMTDSLALARAKKASWIGDLVHRIITDVEQSCLSDISSFMATSSKALLLRHRPHPPAHAHPEMLQKSAVASFRSYLNVPIPAHRKALVRLLTSSHTLAVEVLRWAERRRPPVPRCQRLCRLCGSEVEDEAHVLLYCDGTGDLQDLRARFFHNIFALASPPLAAALKSASFGLHVLHILLDSDDSRVLTSFAKYVFDVFRVINCTPLYHP